MRPSFLFMPLLLSGLLVSCIPYHIYDNTYHGPRYGMSESSAAMYVEEYIATHPNYRYCDLYYIHIRDCYLDQHYPYRIWLIKAYAVFKGYEYRYRSYDIVVRVRALDGRIVN